MTKNFLLKTHFSTFCSTFFYIVPGFFAKNTTKLERYASGTVTYFSSYEFGHDRRKLIRMNTIYIFSFFLNPKNLGQNRDGSSQPQFYEFVPTVGTIRSTYFLSMLSYHTVHNIKYVRIT